MKPRALVALCATLILGAQEAAFAKPAQLTPEQMRRFGEKAVTLGFADQAIAIADQLLLRNPQDATALVIKAQALRIIGQISESEIVARTAWRAAKKPDQPKGLAYASATAVAQALSLQGKRTAAQLWLRRAAQTAPSGAAREQALDDFNYVRQQNPLQLRFDLTLRPSDNVNGGARDPLFVLRGIPLVLSRDALALSGANWGAGVQGRYRLAASPNGETAVTFDLSHQGVLLSEEARKQANEARLLASQVFPFPEFVEIKNGDYALDHAEMGLEKLFGADPAPGLPGQWSLGTTAGQTWYAGRRLSVDYGASIGFARQFDKFAFSTDLGLRKHDRQDHDISSSTDLSLAASLSFKGRAGDQWQASLSHEAVSSKDISIDHQEIGLNLGWRAGKRLAGVGLGASLGVRQVDYAASPYTATGRQDQRLQASITAEISKLSYLGFAPVLGLDYSRSRSNVALYDSAALGVTLSIKSQF